MDGLSPTDWLKFGELGGLVLVLLFLMKMLHSFFSKVSEALIATAVANQAVAERLERIEDRGCANNRPTGGAKP